MVHLHHPDIMQASFPLATDVDVVNLVLSPAVRESPHGFIDGLMGKQGASNDQVIEVAELYKKFSIFIPHSNEVSAKMCALFVLSAPNLEFVSFMKIFMFFWVYSGLDLLVEVIPLFNGCQLGRSIALNDDNFSAL